MLHESEGLFELLVGLSGKAGYHVGAKGSIGETFGQGGDDARISVSPML